MLGRLRASTLDDHLARRCAAVLDARLDGASAAPVAVALSGGGDSLALLHLAAAWTRAHGRPLLALTVDHGLNPASGEWTLAAAAMAAAAGADWRGLAWTGLKPKTGLAAAARRARHGLLAGAAREAGARVILTAHTADDVAEGEIMRAGDAPGLGRLREWAASPLWPDGACVALLRPLLRVARGELRAWLDVRGLRWIEDPANADLAHSRIRARRSLIAAERSICAPEPYAPPLFEADDDGTVRASRAGLTHAPSALVLPQFAAALACAGGTAGPVRGRVCADLLGRLRSGAAVQANVGGAAVSARGDAVTLTPESPRAGRDRAFDRRAVRLRLDLALGRAAREADLAGDRA